MKKLNLKQIYFKEEKVGRHRSVSDEKYDDKELQLGIEIEKEHTDDVNIAKQIVKDHLAELPDYYTRLKKMEKEGKENIQEDVDMVPDTVTMRSFSDPFIENLAIQLKATNVISGMNNDEVRSGLIEELGKMQIYTVKNLNRERLHKAAIKVFTNISQNPSYYSKSQDVNNLEYSDVYS